MRKAVPKQRLLAVFLQELQERSREIERQLLSLDRATEQAERDACLQSLMRAAHSLKGAAGLVEAPSIELICHRMEDLLIAVRDRKLDLDEQAVELLLRANDLLAESGRRLARGEALADAALDGTGAEINVMLGASVDGGPSIPRHSSATPPEVPAREAAVQLRPMPPREGRSAQSAAYARVPAAKLDTMLRQSGELLIARSRTGMRIEQLSAVQDLLRSATFRSGRGLPRSFRSPNGEARAAVPEQWGSGSPNGNDRLLSQIGRDLQELANGLSSDRRAIAQAAGSLDAEVRRARLQPFAWACDGLDRMVRDLALSSGKEASLKISGEAEIDRSIAERLQDLLRHLVRNAVDHGIETPAERSAAGKPPQGTIAISAAIAGDRISVRVTDDGRGLNAKDIGDQAQKLGGEVEGKDVTEQIFLAGLTTAPEVTTSSGRGIGLDIVKTLVERMRGAVEVADRPGQGATFTLTLPTSLGTIRALLVRVGNRLVAIDTGSVDRVLRVSPDDLRFTAGRMFILAPTGPVPALELRAWLGLAQEDGPPPPIRPAMLLNEIGRRAGILVDAVVAEQECLVRTMGPRLQNLREYSGSIILPDGTIALLINAASLGEHAIRSHSARPASPQSLAAVGQRILIADDSVTTRTLEKTILEGAGYDVTAVADGQQAWQVLQERGADLVLADVDMPGLDGFELTGTIRRSAQFRDIPVILLTAREQPEDRKRGLEAGADAYLVKSAFDQRELLRAIAELM